MAEQMSQAEQDIVLTLWRQPASWYTYDRLSALTTRPTAEIQLAVAQLRDDGLVTLFHTGRGVVVALANTRAAREQAIRLTKEPPQSFDSASPCRHNWLLERPDVYLTRGVCKLCGAEKYFLSSTPSGQASWGAVLHGTGRARRD